VRQLPSGVHREGLKPFVSAVTYFCHSVVFHPGKKGVVFAAVEARGTQSGIWISMDGGKSWEKATKGLPSGDRFGRTSLAVTRGKTVYALAGQPRIQALLGVYRSDDLGKTWENCSPRGQFAKDGQLSYTNCIAVDPKSPKTVVIGSLDLFRTENAGRTWERISDGKVLDGERNYVHVDHHAVVIRHGRIYSANDGGFAIFGTSGTQWKTRNTGLAVSMMYDIDVAPTDSRCISAGLQDHGTWLQGHLRRLDLRLKGEAAREATGFRMVIPGDGGWTCYDPDDETHIFASSQRMQLSRHRARDGWQSVNPPVSEKERDLVWMAIVAMDTSPRRGKRRKRRTVYIGSDRLWRSSDDGNTWEEASPVLDGSVISAIEVSAANPKCIYVGTTNGGFFRTVDGADSWSHNLAGPLSPGRIITRIESHRTLPNVVCYTIGLVADVYFVDNPPEMAQYSMLRGGFRGKIGDREALFEFAHLYSSEDGGDTWFCPDRLGLPNLPHHSAIMGPGESIFVAHDGGVSMGKDYEFRSISGNLPNVRITDLVYHERDRLLFASTYGRGCWRVSLDDVERWWKSNPPSGPVPGAEQVLGTEIER
jgi:photosystem II stability/assembly factor-like uncharacterized protein